MLKSYYILLLEDQRKLINLYHHNIYFFKIKYHGDKTFLYADEENYLKMLKYFQLYGISLYKIGGLKKYYLLFKKYQIFTICMLISIIIILVLSHLIFDVSIMTDNKELKNIIKNELEILGISKYRFSKSYEEKEEIKKKILNDYQDKIEWLEIDLVGTKYYIYVLERKKQEENDYFLYQDIVAKKNAVITEIKSSKGEIIKKVNDYVNKGDTIISGQIKKNDEVKNLVKAEGVVYGETWYNVRVELPYTYYEKKYTGNYYNTFTISLFNNRLSLKKDNYQEKEYVDKTILGSNLLPISLNKSKVLEVKNNLNIYTYDSALLHGMTIAKEKLVKNLNSDAKILSQKKLKLYEENSIIIVEVFFKVYENITDYKSIQKEGE